jgi:hypothetical protein
VGHVVRHPVGCELPGEASGEIVAESLRAMGQTVRIVGMLILYR